MKKNNIFGTIILISTVSSFFAMNKLTETTSLLSRMSNHNNNASECHQTVTSIIPLPSSLSFITNITKKCQKKHRYKKVASPTNLVASQKILILTSSFLEIEKKSNKKLKLFHKSLLDKKSKKGHDSNIMISENIYDSWMLFVEIYNGVLIPLQHQTAHMSKKIKYDMEKWPMRDPKNGLFEELEENQLITKSERQYLIKKFEEQDLPTKFQKDDWKRES